MLIPVAVNIGHDDHSPLRWATIDAIDPTTGEVIGVGGWYIAPDDTLVAFKRRENWGHGMPPFEVPTTAAAYCDEWWFDLEAVLAQLRAAALPLLERAMRDDQASRSGATSMQAAP